MKDAMDILYRVCLCMDGLYRWIRHPMYSIMYLLVFSWLAASANWFIGLYWTAVLTVVVTRRISAEEAAMIETFGDRYRSYMQTTGRFFPCIFPRQ